MRMRDRRRRLADEGATMAVVWAILLAIALSTGMTGWWLRTELLGWRPVQSEAMALSSVFAGVID
jgi:uncharacterized protein HemX